MATQEPTSPNSCWKTHVVSCLLLAGMAAGSWRLFFTPLFAEHQAMQQHLSFQETYLNRRQEIQSEHAKLVAEMDTIEETLRKLDQQIPATPQESEFLAAISRATTERNIVVQEYRPGAIQPETDYLQVNFSARGSYPDICGFIHDLNHLPRLSRITNLKITSRHPGQTSYPFEMQIRIYFSRDPVAMLETSRS